MASLVSSNSTIHCAIHASAPIRPRPHSPRMDSAPIHTSIRSNEHHPAIRQSPISCECRADGLRPWSCSSHESWLQIRRVATLMLGHGTASNPQSFASTPTQHTPHHTTPHLFSLSGQSTRRFGLGASTISPSTFLPGFNAPARFYLPSSNVSDLLAVPLSNHEYPCIIHVHYRNPRRM